MQKNLKRMLACVLVVVMMLTAAPLSGFVGLELPEKSELFVTRAGAISEGYLTYTVSNGEATITGYTSSIIDDAVIPDTVGGYPVTSIDEYAFEDCDSLTSITIPGSITSIGRGAFDGCTSLNKVNISDLAAWCRISFDYKSNPLYYAKKLYLNNSLATNIMIPDSVTNISVYAFSGCTSLISVIIPDSVTNIGDYTFEDCTGLTSITIPDSVTSIGDWVFSGCTGLTSITIPASVTSIGAHAFSRCSGLKNINVDYNNSIYASFDGALLNKDKTVMIYCPAGKASYVIPDTVISIGHSAFEYCNNLTSVTIPESVTFIDDYAFYSCTGLTDVTIPNSVTSIGNQAFRSCTGLTSLTIGFNVTSIGRLAFYKCTALTKIFWNAENVKDFTVGEDVFGEAGTAGDGIDVVFGDKVKNIPDYAFTRYYNKHYFGAKIKSLKISDSVFSIGDYAFSGCSYLTSVTIPDCVKNVGSEAFRDCTKLMNADIGSGVTSIGDDTFYGCQALTDVTIGDSVTSIGSCAFYKCRSLTSITIPDSVTSIGSEAFCYCQALTDVTIGAALQV